MDALSQLLLDKISQKYFGTTDYASVLSVLSPADASVKQFKQACLDQLGQLPDDVRG